MRGRVWRETLWSMARKVSPLRSNSILYRKIGGGGLRAPVNCGGSQETKTRFVVSERRIAGRGACGRLTMRTELP